MWTLRAPEGNCAAWRVKRAETGATMTTTPRATNIDDAYRACNHNKPLASDDQRYEDFSTARGDNTAASIKARLTRSEDGEFVHVAFVSHRGAGKTTEILRVCDDLKSSFFSYYFEANLQLDENHITAEDLLLTLAMGVEEHFAKHKMPLPAKLITSVHNWFSEVVKSTEWGTELSASLGTEASAGGEIPFFASLKAELKALIRTESKYRTQVQEAFRKFPGTLLRNVNNLLDEARKLLGEKQLLVVIDNLDRYDPRVVDELLFKGGRPIRDLHCHLIVTPPIALYYKPVSEPIQRLFHPEIMNTVRLRNRKQPYDAFDENSPGRRLMLEALDKRMDVAKLIPDVAAQNRLVSASGGAIRDLLRIVREAIILVPGAVLEFAAIDRAASRIRTDMRDRINANGWVPSIAKIMQEKQVNDGPACMDVLYQQLAFKYNGEGWYDAHPLVAEIPEVRAAYDKLLGDAQRITRVG